MNPKEILARFSALNVWQRGDKRAPHKPLLLLFAIGKCLRGEERLISFEVVAPAVKDLLSEFGNGNPRPHYPFWRLQNDGVWELKNAELVATNQSGDVRERDLFARKVRGGFLQDIFDAFRSNHSLAEEAVQLLLEHHFPYSQHERILDMTGIQLSPPKRDPGFRERVLIAYGYACAICGFNLRLKDQSVGLDASHIKWKGYRGPDAVSNGLALCVVHHKFFDYGALTLSDDNKVILSEQLNGEQTLLKSQFLAYEHVKIRIPRKTEDHPDKAYVRWHRKEVYRG